MPKFQFKLEALLKVRLRAEEKAEREFAEAMRKVETQRSRINEKQAQIDESRNFNQSMDPLYLRSAVEWTARLKREYAQLAEILTQLKLRVEEKRTLLLQAQKERKALDILKEKKYEEYLEERKKREQSFSDEMAVVRHFRAGLQGDLDENP